MTPIMLFSFALRLPASIPFILQPHSPLILLGRGGVHPDHKDYADRDEYQLDLDHFFQLSLHFTGDRRVGGRVSATTMTLELLF